MVDLAQAAGVVAVVLKMLRHGGYIRQGGAQRASDFKYLRSGWMPPREHGDAGGRAKGLLDIAALKDQPAPRQGVKMRRLHRRITITTKLWAHVIASNEEDVQLVCRHGSGVESQEYKER